MSYICRVVPQVYDSYIATLTKKPQVVTPGVVKEQERPRVSTESGSSKSSDGELDMWSTSYTLKQ